MSDDITNTGENNDTTAQNTSTTEAKTTTAATTRSEAKSSEDAVPRTKTGQVITQDYVDRLKEESKSHRLKLKEAEDKLSKAEQEKDELAKHSVERVAQLSSAFEKRLITAEMVVLADKEGLKDKDYFKLCDLSKVSVSADGEIVGLQEALSELKTKKPDLFQKVSNTNTGVGDVESGSTETKFTRPVYKDKAEFEKAKRDFISSVRRQ